MTSKISEMKKYCIFGLLFFVFSCAPPSQDVDFKVFIRSFHQSKVKQFPLWAAQAGQGRFEKTFPIPNRKKHKSDLQFCKKYHDSLQLFDTSRLSVPLQFEYNKIKPFLSNHIYSFEVLKIHESDPTYYDLRETFSQILKKKSESIEQRLEIFENNLRQVPEYYSAAIENLKTPEQEKLQAAIEQQIQFYNFLDKNILPAFQKSNLTKSQLTELESLTFQAKLSLKDFIAFCKSAAFEHLNEALNATPAGSPKEQFEKVFTGGK
jgi:hypothetical protein